VPLLWLSLFFLSGILLAAWTHFPVSFWAGVAGGSLFFWQLLHRLPGRRLRWLSSVKGTLKLPPFLLLVALGAGALRYQLSRPAFGPGDLAYYHGGGEVELTATVSQSPEPRDTVTLLRLEAESLQQAGQTPPLKVRGALLAMLPPDQGWHYGDRLILRGTLTPPPESETFSFRNFLARQGIFSYMAYPQVQWIESGAGNPLMTAIDALRQRAHRVVEALFPPPEAPLLDGILLGLDKGLPPSIEEAFRRTGTSHIIAISGFNMAVLAGLFAGLFGRVFSRWWATLIALTAMVLYTLLVGGGAAVVRAAIMSGLSLIAVQIGRRSSGLNSLLFAAGVMCFFNPDLPWDVSFQLSFAATLGLVVYAARLEGFFRRRVERWFPVAVAGPLTALVAENVLFTLAAQAFTLPVLFYHFGRISLIAPLANFFILPAQSSLMIFSGLAVLVGMVFLPLGRLLAAPGWALASYTLHMVSWLGASPGVELVAGPGRLSWVLAMFAILLLSLKISPAWLKSHLPRLAPATGLVLAAGLAGLLWRQVLASGDGALHVIAFQFEGKTPLLIRTPAGRAVLINGSERASQLSAALGRWLPPLNRSLDAFILNEPSSGTLKALPETLKRFPPQRAFLAAALPENATGRNLRESLQIETIPLQNGDTLDLGQGVRLQARACNPQGCALLLEWDRFAMLFPGGKAPEELPDPQTGMLLLTPADLKTTPLDTWKTHFQATILDAASLPPDGWLHLQTDGTRLWVSRSP